MFFKSESNVAHIFRHFEIKFKKTIDWEETFLLQGLKKTKKKHQIASIFFALLPNIIFISKNPQHRRKWLEKEKV